MSHNIVFIHRGNSWYLPYTLWQCRQTNHSANIYLIGDNHTQHFNKWIRHIPIEAFNHDLIELQKAYVHHSTLGQDFELPCIERWFILKAFMVSHKLQSCIYLDSDILVYSDLGQFEPRFRMFDMTWLGFSAHTNYISKVKALESYCNLVLDLYGGRIPLSIADRGLFPAVISGKRLMNISDMTFFHDYNLSNPNSLVAIYEPAEYGCFDNSIEDVAGFESGLNGLKTIHYHGKQPYCRNLTSGNLVRMITLHFQGKGKKVLKENFKYRSTSFLRFKAVNDFSMFLHRIQRNLPFVESK